jgi:hypothetical protein
MKECLGHHWPTGFLRLVQQGILWSVLTLADDVLSAPVAPICQDNGDCPTGRCLSVAGSATQRRCAATLAVSGPVSHERVARSLADRKLGDACDYSVDCLPGYRCFQSGPFIPNGTCLPPLPPEP